MFPEVQSPKSLTKPEEKGASFAPFGPTAPPGSILGGQMRKSRFGETQIVAILKEGEAGVPIAEIVRKHGISKNTFFEWRRKYAGATMPDLKRLRELEAENAKLTRMYTDLALEKSPLMIAKLPE
jgi:putative transposase